MTNVPDNIREMWREVYVLFDKHFLMDVSKDESWQAFWDDAHVLLSKYQNIQNFIELIGVVSQLIYSFSQGRKKDEKM